MDNQLLGNYVLDTGQPQDGPFEIGLVMAGAISAGAYEAGALDYLFEALDAWEAAKARVKGSAEENQVPQHQVVIKVVAAASAGSMSAAIMAVAARHDFEHVGSAELGVECYSKQPLSQRTAAFNKGRRNPFFKAWVQDISMDQLLTTRDLDAKDSVLRSLLDSTVLQSITDDCLAFTGKGVVHRSYMGDPTRYIFTLANLRGVPYFLPFNAQNSSGLEMSMHRDYRSFTLSYSLGGGARVLRGDDIALDWGNRGSGQWPLLGLTALSSGAFPVGLAARPMIRLATDYNFRFVVLPGTNSQPTQAVNLQHCLNILPPGLFKSFVVDGGTMNNEPVDLARQELAGLIGRNERNGVDTRRALLMIDPFPDPPTQVPGTLAGQSPELFSVIGGLLGAWKNQARFKPEDLALAADEKVYSRYLIAPSRGGGDPDKPNLACGALGGFSGFFSQDFRQHDYLLGRRNAQKFLSDIFTLPVSNSLFTSLDPTQKVAGAKWVRKGAGGVLELPIIPLMDELLPGELSGGLSQGRAEALGDWPYDVFRISSIEPALKARLDKLIKLGVDGSGMKWYQRWYIKFGVVISRGSLYGKLSDWLVDGLAEGGLLPKRPGAMKKPPPRDWFAEP
ncbi:hypothetical protein J4P02_11525 [Pseudomonas sp. NFXW11]|uniref:hypothetical protein n=1 Tax=Pseudomonas sp. NFXW11 TaxID=2819531 RepID=UPI003CF8DDEC